MGVGTKIEANVVRSWDAKKQTNVSEEERGRRTRAGEERRKGNKRGKRRAEKREGERIFLWAAMSASGQNAPSRVEACRVVIIPRCGRHDGQASRWWSDIMGRHALVVLDRDVRPD